LAEPGQFIRGELLYGLFDLADAHHITPRCGC
jgi:hypothetical protein